MTYGQKYVIRWTPRLKRKLLIIVVVIFFIGLVVGFAVGRVSAVDNKDENVVEVTKAPISTTPLITDTPKEETEKPVVDTIVIPVEPKIAYFDVPLSTDLQDYIFSLCESNNVPVALIMAMIETESSFRANIISGTNDYGLMQINSINHEWLSEEYGITDFLDPYQNVFCGITIIAGHLEKTDGDITKALMRYNCGPTGAWRLWDKGIYSTSYTEKIEGGMAKYE